MVVVVVVVVFAVVVVISHCRRRRRRSFRRRRRPPSLAVGYYLPVSSLSQSVSQSVSQSAGARWAVEETPPPPPHILCMQTVTRNTQHDQTHVVRRARSDDATVVAHMARTLHGTHAHGTLGVVAGDALELVEGGVEDDGAALEGAEYVVALGVVPVSAKQLLVVVMVMMMMIGQLCLASCRWRLGWIN